MVESKERVGDRAPGWKRAVVVVRLCATTPTAGGKDDRNAATMTRGSRVGADVDVTKRPLVHTQWVTQGVEEAAATLTSGHVPSAVHVFPRLVSHLRVRVMGDGLGLGVRG